MRTAFITMLSLALVTLAACGNDDDSLPDVEVQTATATAKPTKSPEPETESATQPPTPVVSDTPPPTTAPTPEQPPTALTDEMIQAIDTYVTENDFLGARREMTDPPTCDEAVGDDVLPFLGKVCVLPQTFALEGTDVVVRAGVWSSDGVLDMVLRNESGTWTVIEAREPEGGAL
jgi:hypothetical protein